MPGTGCGWASRCRSRHLYTTPCKKIARWFSDGNFARLSQKISGRVRVYAKVLSGGA